MQTDTLNFSPQYIGLMESLEGGAGLLGALIYGVVCRRLNLRQLLTAAIALNVTVTLLYLRYSHATAPYIHAIVGFAVMDPAGYAAETSAASYIFGGIGYAFIIAMTATSFNRTAQALGSRAWRALHLAGGYYLLFQFMVSFGKRIPDMPLYALFLIPLVAVFVLRMVSMAAKASPRPAQAG